MRISKDQANTIKQAVFAVLGKKVNVTLFGSRVDDTQKGGDIDLMITSTESILAPAEVVAKIAAKLESPLGSRKIDILLNAPNLKKQAIHEVAIKTGVLL